MQTCGTVFGLQDIDFCTLGNVNCLTTWKKVQREEAAFICCNNYRRSPAREGAAAERATGAFSRSQIAALLVTDGKRTRGLHHRNRRHTKARTRPDQGHVRPSVVKASFTQKSESTKRVAPRASSLRIKVDLVLARNPAFAR